MTLGYLYSKPKSYKVKLQENEILFDTGCGAILIHHRPVHQLKTKKRKNMQTGKKLKA